VRASLRHELARPDDRLRRTGGTTVNVAGLAIAVLQLEATPAAARRRYMALAG
jgi:hypothetical protein